MSEEPNQKLCIKHKINTNRIHLNGTNRTTWTGPIAMRKKHNVIVSEL